MQNFVALQINGPVSVLNLRIGFLRFLCQHTAAFAQAVVPDGVENPDFFRVNGLDEVPRRVSRSTDGHDDFIAKRQERKQAFPYRVIVLYSVAYEGESGDFHGIKSPAD